MLPKRHLISGRWFYVSQKDCGQITEPRGTGGNVHALLVSGKNITAKISTSCRRNSKPCLFAIARQRKQLKIGFEFS